MRVPTPILFATVVLAWGLTWYAIRLQLGPVPIEVSVFWRFAASAALLALGLLVTRRVRPVPWRQHRWLALLGLTLFSTNFLLIYNSEIRLPSGIVSVLFSMATVFTTLNRWLVLGVRPTARALVGGALGVCGLALLFGIDPGSVGSRLVAGLFLALGGTLLFSFGNLVSARIAALGVDLPNAVLRGMGWGTAYLAILVLLRGDGFAVPLTAGWLGGLAYLSAIGSVLGFLAYLSLALRIGADRAAYTTVLSPVVALVVSSLLENYGWSVRAFCGLGLILLGNVAIFTPRDALTRLIGTRHA